MKNDKSLKVASPEKLKSAKVAAGLDIGISAKNAQAVANKLQQLLSDEQILYAKTRNYHWNIEGPNFMEMHKFYEGLYGELAEVIDQIAERIRKIGHYAQGRLEDFLKQTNLLEGEYTNDQNTQLRNLLSDHEVIIRNLRNDIKDFEDKYKDVGTTDFVTGLLQEHEQWAWFLRSYITK
ncbi:Dps family protein [Arachidicoccus soli]|uniref:DNA starvation/stationary phase protection protein n=1 Tax=Arachidicoccus soli TaxID=2341117 RepID=A0A386HLT7_9BACT|nr:DNA starvation/stationary phase protection protein [Arachidicoccus soli]AYD46745.1 DNA starvation/stationary phase protection protein [Arachidicoccus soli]